MRFSLPHPTEMIRPGPSCPRFQDDQARWIGPPFLVVKLQRDAICDTSL